MKITKVYCDMDGVLADFDGYFKSKTSLTPSEFEKAHGRDEFWKAVFSDGTDPHAFLKLPLFAHTHILYAVLKHGFADVKILTSPSKTNREICIMDKQNWANKHLGILRESMIFEKEKFKYAEPGALLIDDWRKHTSEWEERGGRAILFRNWEDCLVELAAILSNNRRV